MEPAELGLAGRQPQVAMEQQLGVVRQPELAAERRLELEPSSEAACLVREPSSVAATVMQVASSVATGIVPDQAAWATDN